MLRCFKDNTGCKKTFVISYSLPTDSHRWFFDEKEKFLEPFRSVSVLEGPWRAHSFTVGETEARRNDHMHRLLLVLLEILKNTLVHQK